MAYLLLVLVVLGAVVMMMQKSRATRRNCRWDLVPGGTDNLNAFRCKTCGVVAFSRNRSGPSECKKGLEGRL